MTAKQPETKNDSAGRSPHIDSMTPPAERLISEKLDEVSRINQKTVADECECDDATTQSGLVQLTPALAAWKSNVRSEAKASVPCTSNKLGE